MPMTTALLPYSCFLVLLLNQGVSAYTALPRWGQASAVINDALFIHGGKTDEFNSYSYASAPSNNDLLYLPLSSPFDPSSPPWQLISSSSNTSTSQGPALAWHTLSAFQSSQLLLFGGEPGPNSPTVLPARADSAELLDVNDRSKPSWIPQSASWANEPTRRIHHSASSSGGKIWLVGGEKADGSSNAFLDHYVFDPATPSFTQLPGSNGPPDLYGHASVICNGKLLVFGGYSQSMSALLPFNNIWSMDTSQPNLSWTTLDVSNAVLPTPRRAFVAAVLDDGKVLIHGGADATQQTTYDDGWMLDTSTAPITWTAVTALSQLGPRRDHFAVTMGSSVIFGFGFGSNGPVSAALNVFDTSGGTFLSTFAPPPSSSSVNTFQPPTQTSNPGSGSNTSSGGGSRGSPTGSGASTYPTGTSDGTGQQDDDKIDKKKHTTAIAVGSTLGILGLVAAGAALVIVYHRRHGPSPSSHFQPLGGRFGGSGDDESRYHDIPTVHGLNNVRNDIRSGTSPLIRLMQTLGLGAVGTHRRPASMQQRRDMLADEDTRQFGDEPVYRWNDGNRGSTWSLLSVFGGGSARKSRDLSTHSSTPWREKSDPFSDSAALMTLDDAPKTPPSARLSLYRQSSYESTVGRSSYVDPFADPIEETLFEMHEDAEVEGGDRDGSTRHRTPPPVRTVLPGTTLHTLSTLTEQTSRSSDFTASASSHAGVSPLDGSRANSRASDNATVAPRTHTSIIDSIYPPSQPIRRSDTWWARFSKTPFLDRRSSDAGKSHSKVLDFRDPNPPPQLGPIQEASANSGFSEFPTDPKDSKASRNGPFDEVDTTIRRRSASSLQTADSEAFERMGAMDVVQRMGTTDSQRTGHTSGQTSPRPESPPPPLPRLMNLSKSQYLGDEDATVESPIEVIETETPGRDNFSSNRPPTSSQPGSPTKQLRISEGVSSRVQAYERRMSQVSEGSRSPGSPLSPGVRNTRRWEERPAKKSLVNVNYGLAPRPSLYVANPDHSLSPSSSET